MADRSHPQAPKHDPRPQAAAPAWRTLTAADAVAHCPEHRVQHDEAEARYAAFLAENGASMARRDRLTLGRRTLPRRAVNA